GLGGKIGFAQRPGGCRLQPETGREERRHRNTGSLLPHAGGRPPARAHQTVERRSRRDRKNFARRGTGSIAAAMERTFEKENVHSLLLIQSTRDGFRGGFTSWKTGGMSYTSSQSFYADRHFTWRRHRHRSGSNA